MESAQRQTQAAPGAFTAFARFVLCGGGVGVASSFAVVALAACMPWALANALITVASTLLATELHARFTFGAGRRGTWRQHVQSAGSAAAAYGVTCVAMFVLHQLVAAPGALLEQAVYLSASALAGAARFVVLRLVVFAGGRKKTATPATAPVRARVPAQASRARHAARPAPIAVALTSGPTGPSAVRFHSIGLSENNAAPALCTAA
ncbi:GtrA family protein [Streptomyces montanus]|uniref:GtrA family protein n=1 Tax=Streptomyces montanus TaxID=2580423 RepID=UPI00268026E3